MRFYKKKRYRLNLRKIPVSIRKRKKAHVEKSRISENHIIMEH
jgi:hypothetical protein